MCFEGLIDRTVFWAEFLQTVGRLIQQYGKCFRIWLGTQMLIVITEPKDVEV